MYKKFFNNHFFSFILLMFLAYQIHAATGYLDPTFGTGGKLTTDFGSFEDGLTATLQPDGKIVVVGRAFANLGNGNFDNFAVARYNPDGTLDTSFDGDGKVITAVGSGNSRALSVALQADGKIVVTGAGLNNSNADFAVVRYNPNGSLDTSFGGSGIILTNITTTTSGTSPSSDTSKEVLIQPDGKIIVIGETADRVFGLSAVRYNSNGSLDNSFGTNGIKTLQYFSSSIVFRNWSPTSAILQSDGKIVIGGYVNIPISFDFAIVRLNSDGSPDTTFGLNYSEPNNSLNPGFTVIPVETPSFNDEIADIAIQSDGKIIAVGRTYRGNVAGGPVPSKFAVVRLNTSGTLDNSFGGNGIVTTGFISMGGDGDEARSIVIQSDNKIVVGGRADSNPVTNSTNSDFALARYNPDGSLDGSFGIGGKVLTDFSRQIGTVTIVGQETVTGLVLQSDGKIVAVGATAIGAPNDFALARYITASDTKFDFDGDSKTDISIFRPSVGQWWYLKSGDGGNAAFNFGQASDLLSPADFTGDGKADITFFRPSDGFWYVLRSEDSSFFSFPFGANGDIPAPADFDGDGKADPAVFRPSNQTWYISKSTGGTLIVQFGFAEDKPVVADYDGDGKADIAIFRPSVGQWWYLRSSDGTNRAFQFGLSTDKPVPGDYTGDGKADIAFWRPSDGFWYILRSEDDSFFSFPFGTNGDISAPGDYDGDGRIDPAVFRPSSNTWFINRTTSGLLIINFGLNGDQPVPAAFVP